MSASARAGSVLRKVFTAHVALGVAFVIVLSSLGAYFAASGSATPTQQLNMVAPAAPATAVPSIAPKTPTPATPKPVTKVLPKVIYRAPARSTYVAPAPAHHATAAGGSQMKTALIIGVGNPVGATALPGADADAKNERQALLNDGFPAANIQMLIDSQATRAHILSGLASLANRTNHNGTAVFAVSTHSSQDSFRTYEGNRISRSEVAGAIGRVPGRVLSIFAVCYADSYNTPGVTGANHLAVFSSAGGEETWESPAGSDFIRGFVLEAMLEHKAANASVEAAFTYADHEMLANKSGHPSISDGVPGNFVLSR